jgi:hypothetical protein
MPKDIVTLSTFGMQMKWQANQSDVKKFIDGQIANIREFKQSFDAAAYESGREPPEIVLSALMIPQWKNGDNYTNQNYEAENYLAVKQEYFDYLRQKCHESGIRVQDFYLEAATSDEKQYLNQLEALGSTADLIKNRAIINNQGNRHLQIDTNTIVVDKKEFYKSTIGANTETQKDGMNASYYDDSGLYISPHNKVVYTCETSEFAQNLEKQHNEFVTDSKDRLDRKTPSSNHVYSTAFCKAAMNTGLVNFNREYYQQWNNLWGYYPVQLKNPIYEMSKHIITAINMSWSQGDGKVDYCAALKNIKVDVPAPSGEKTTIDFQAFAYLIKKYTNPKLPPEEREQFLAISDVNYDQRAIEIFVSNVIDKKNISILGPLLRSINYTDGGKIIRNKLFEIFKNVPSFLDTVQNPNIDSKVSPEDLRTLADFIPDGAGLDAEKEKLKYAAQELIRERKIELESILPTLKAEIYVKVKEKLDSLGAPYIVTDQDKTIISTIIDKMDPNILQDNNIEQFQLIALNLATNKVFSDRLKMQPAVQEALEDASSSTQDKISKKIYQLPINEKFNRGEIDSMVNRVASDIKILEAEPVKGKFFEDSSVKQFIHWLNALAAIRPIIPEREVQIERMAETIITAVKSFTQTPHIAFMSKHLQENYDKLQDKYQTTVRYSDFFDPIQKDTLMSKLLFTVKPSQNIKNELQKIVSTDHLDKEAIDLSISSSAPQRSPH